jgi:formate hydrogenlyase transcriptional activator
MIRVDQATPSRAHLGTPLEFETLLCELSSRFITVPPEAVDREIEDAQRRICESLGLDLSALWEGTAARPGEFTLTHFYGSQEDVLPPMRGMSATEYFPWLLSEMLANRPVAVSSLEELPEAAARDRDNLRTFGVQSNLTVPLSVGGGTPVGALGFNSTRVSRDWPDGLVKRLQLVAQVFANALARKRTDEALRDSEARLSLAADSAEAGLWALDHQTGIFWASDRCRTIMGFGPDTVVTMERLRASVHPDDWDLVVGALEEGRRALVPVNVEYRVVVPGDDGVRWVFSRGRTRVSASGEPVRAMGVTIDVTERKRAEQALREHLRFETLAADLSSRMLDVGPADIDREISEALGGVCQLLGVDLAVLWQWSAATPGLIAPTHVHPPAEGRDSPEPLSQKHYPWVVQQMLAGRPVVFSRLDELPEEASIDRESARAAGIKSNLTLPLGQGGASAVGALAFSTLREERQWPDAVVKRLGLIAEILTNALARTQHERALRESEALSRGTFEQAAVGIAHVGLDGRWLRVNDKLCSIIGYPREELLRSSFQDITHPDDLEADLQHVREVLSGEMKTYSIEKRYIRKDRSLVWIELTVSLARTAAGEPRHFISVIEDITERKLAQEALRASEARLAAGADLAGLAFYEVDFVSGTMYVDDRLRAICGAPPDVTGGLAVLDFWMEHLHPDDRGRVMDVRQQMQTGGLDRASLEYRYLHPSGAQQWIQHIGGVSGRDDAGQALKTFGVFRDITERRRREEALRHSLVEIERLKDRLQAESDYLKAEIRVTQARGELTGRSAAVISVLQQIEQVAPTDSTVLVRGETGSGKELVAQAIHRLSPRCSHLMVKVNCAALPAGLVESELFGREKGAFTGALTRQAGRFEVADGSTLFLDEIGELSLDLQSKLLRVLESGEFERLGSSRTIKVNVRLIAATNRDLSQAIKQGRFREDLYYRLNVFPIRVPPLRERPDDIPLLVWAFLEELSSRMGKRITQIPRKTMEALQRHAWPGNVRELRNVIEHAAIVTTGDTLRVPMIEEAAAAVAPAQAQTLAEAEREFILGTLERTGWQVKGPKGAAVALGLKPATLYSRMKKLGIRLRGQATDQA